MKKQAVLAVTAAVVYAAGHQAVTSAVPPAAMSAPTGSNEALANQMAAGYGWTGGQAACLDALWTEESGFSTAALNPSSGATGIPQLLPSAHAIPADWSDPRTQIRWGLAYIKGRYGTPCAAWAHEKSQSPNWY